MNNQKSLVSLLQRLYTYPVGIPEMSEMSKMSKMSKKTRNLKRFRAAELAAPEGLDAKPKKARCEAAPLPPRQTPPPQLPPRQTPPQMPWWLLSPQQTPQQRLEREQQAKMQIYLASQLHNGGPSQAAAVPAPAMAPASAPAMVPASAPASAPAPAMVPAPAPAMAAASAPAPAMAAASAPAPVTAPAPAMAAPAALSDAQKRQWLSRALHRADQAMQALRAVPRRPGTLADAENAYQALQKAVICTRELLVPHSLEVPLVEQLQLAQVQLRKLHELHYRTRQQPQQVRVLPQIAQPPLPPPPPPPPVETMRIDLPPQRRR